MQVSCSKPRNRHGEQQAWRDAALHNGAVQDHTLGIICTAQGRWSMRRQARCIFARLYYTQHTPLFFPGSPSSDVPVPWRRGPSPSVPLATLSTWGEVQDLAAGEQNTADGTLISFVDELGYLELKATGCFLCPDSSPSMLDPRPPSLLFTASCV